MLLGTWPFGWRPNVTSTSGQPQQKSGRAAQACQQRSAVPSASGTAMQPITLPWSFLAMPTFAGRLGQQEHDAWRTKASAACSRQNPGAAG
eukprot:1507568-Alexandrium_andersonii.AAC.1